MIKLFTVLIALLKITIAANIWPGPVTTTTTNNVEQWTASVAKDSTEDYTYTVKNLPAAARPTLVYNCNILKSICNNAKQWLPANTLTYDFHYDRLQNRVPGKDTTTDVGTRAKTRGGTACPSNWINKARTDSPGPVAGQRCPEADQPEWAYGSDMTLWPSTIFMDTSTTPATPSHNRLAAEDFELNTATNQVETTYRPLGAVYSCDEFPAKSWIEGGSAATTYCAPISLGCKITSTLGLVNPVTATDQDWQGRAHNTLRNYFASYTPTGRKAGFSNDLEYTIWGFTLELRDDDSGDATWVEAGGHKRYCHGPVPSSKSICKPIWADDPVRPA